jgi:hypothetical protein
MAKRLTAEKYARHLIRRLYEATDGKPRQWRMMSVAGSDNAALALAVKRGWIAVEGGHSVCLTDEGRNVVRSELN